MSLAERVRRKLIRTLLPVPVEVTRAEYSLLLTAHDDPGRPSERLVDLALAAVAEGRRADLGHLTSRLEADRQYLTVWPGEHYRLLAGLVRVLQPKLVIEIGTGQGISAVTMLPFLPAGGRLVTYDLVGWQEDPATVLGAGDFVDGRLEQRRSDLTDPAAAAGERELLAAADFLFVDAAKDGVQEQRFLDLFETIPFAAPPVLLFDDIRLWNMLRIWREIRRPKLDLTSFGHWSGTGLVDWAEDS